MSDSDITPDHWRVIAEHVTREKRLLERENNELVILFHDIKITVYNEALSTETRLDKVKKLIHDSYYP